MEFILSLFWDAFLALIATRKHLTTRTRNKIIERMQRVKSILSLIVLFGGFLRKIAEKNITPGNDDRQTNNVIFHNISSDNFWKVSLRNLN